MEVPFTPEQEAQLSQIATQAGTDTVHLVRDAALRVLEDVRFREGVERGMAAVRRGEYVESDEVWVNVERILQP